MTLVDLDANATTRPLPEVVEVVALHLRDTWGNPGSRHGLGRQARRILEDSRESIAARLGADPDEVVFTSGGTEANNMAVFSLARGAAGTVMLTPGEHPANLEACRVLQQRGWTLRMLSVDDQGRLTPSGMTQLEGVQTSRLCCSPTTRSASSKTWPHWRMRAAVNRFCSTWMPYRRSAKFPSTFTESGRDDAQLRRAQVSRAARHRWLAGETRDAIDAAVVRRPSGAGPPAGHGAGGAHRRHGDGAGELGPRSRPAYATRIASAGPAAGGVNGTLRPDRRQRRTSAPAAEHAEHRLSRRGRRSAAGGARSCRRVLFARQHVRQRVDGAGADAGGDGLSAGGVSLQCALFRQRREFRRRNRCCGRTDFCDR